jgi:hypothetical protein
MVGGILTTAGIMGFLSNLAAFYEAADEDYSEWSGFLEALRQWSGGQQFTVATLATALGDESNTTLRDALPGFLADRLGKPTLRHGLGKALSAKDEARYDGLRLVKAGVSHKVVQWQVKADTPPSDGPRGGFGGFGGFDCHSSCLDVVAPPVFSRVRDCESTPPNPPVENCLDCGARLHEDHRARGYCFAHWLREEDGA